MSETEPVSWRIYRDEWISAFTAHPHSSSRTPMQTAVAHFDEFYRGRVLDRDVRYVPNDGDRTVTLQLRLPNLRGEFKTRELAEQFETQVFAGEENVYVCGADTAEDRDLRSYGIKQLPEQQPVQLYDRISVELDAAEDLGAQ